MARRNTETSAARANQGERFLWLKLAGDHTAGLEFPQGRHPTYFEPLELFLDAKLRNGLVEIPQVVGLVRWFSKRSHLEAVRLGAFHHNHLSVRSVAEGQNFLAEKNEAIRAMTPVGGKPALYICEDFTCQASVTEVRELRDLL